MSTITGTSGNDTINGGNGVDTIYGGDGNDIISGGNGVDTLFGEGGNDQLTGDNGADNLTGGAGDDVIDGSNGHDTAYYSGPIGEYSFFSAAGYLHVVHLGGAGADGHDRVINVERLVFADRVIDIGSGKNAPVAGDDHVFINEDTGTYSSGAGSVLNNDFDFDGDPLTVSGGTFTGTYGTLTLNSNGTYSYTLFASVQGLDDGENVTDSFNYTVTDNDGSDTGTLVFHIAGLNDAPVANDDTASTTEDAAVSGNVLANDTDVDVEPLIVANPGTYVGAYGTLVLAANGSYTYTPNAAAQGLDTGEVAQDVFSYTASDGTASDTATLTVTVNGVNDAPVANDDTAFTNEDSAGVSGNVLTNDTDVDVEPLTVANPGTYIGAYGTLTLAADGSYTYVPGAAAQGLDTGEVGQDVFTYTASDGTASDTATLTVSVNGLNDAPVANDDTAATDENTSVSGNVLANDTDVDVETLTVTNPGTYIGAYGTLVLAANGSYTYTPTGAAQALTEGQVVNDIFNYIASDGTASDAATLTVTVTGLGGVPHANDDTASTLEDNSVSGNVLTNDTDDENDPLTVSNPGTYVGTYGTLTLGANGSYTYTPNATADGLAAGETGQDVFSYTATDGTGSDTATLTVTVNGTNDAPTIDVGGTDADGSVAELPDGDPNEGTAVHSDSGAVAFDDLDLSDTHSASFTPQGGGYFGTFTLDPVDQMGDSVGWDFAVSDAALENLSDGETRIQTYTVQIDDSHGGTVTQDVVITITGAGVGTGPQTVWYIDNSAVGSANLGTQADPYTSIAAFNAAQGTLGGPQVGDTVHLLAGTGTGVYAEADGINLLNGQTLVGDASGAVRPTIEALAGDGVNVAQNNTISGLDIGNTSGADIADSGGSVGTLTISDVGSSGTGQIIDVDQGGTLTVTLNGAESLGSSGGAIDLAGVGGSFTVTGATTITGVHSGGGIDITGSSVAATFAGGGNVATLTTTAVNFVGNSGALALDGGFAIVTTSGAGLNATGGGTVTVTGAGNSIVSTTGTALNVDNTNIGAADLTFVSISSNGAASGIVLNNTGSSGGLTVTGTGAADSGGTIQNSTGDGIRLTSTQDVSLTEVRLNNSADNNVDATNVTNLTLNSLLSDGSGNTNLLGSGVTNLTISNGSAFDHSGNGVGDHGIFITNLFGTSSITNTSFANSAETEVRITNTAATVAQGSLAGDVLTMSAVTFAFLSGGVTGDNIQINANLAANMHFILDGSVGSNTIAGGITGVLVNANSGGDIDVDIANTTITAGTGAGINFSTVGTGSRIWFDVHDNVITGRNAASLNATSINNAVIEGRFTSNSITQGANGNGMNIIAEGTGVAGTASATVSATNNTITGVQNGGGINAQARLGGILNLTLDDNHVNINNALNLDGIRVTAGSSAADNSNVVRLNMLNNDVTVGPASGQEDYALQVRGTNVFQLQGFTGNGNSADTVDEINWINVVENNRRFDGVSTPVDQIQHTGGGIFTASAGAIPTPILPSPLLADPASSPAAAGNGAGLTQGQVDFLVEAAIQRWGDAGLASEQLADMRAVSVGIADMAGSAVGSAIRGHISVDSNAGGHGWFVDSTPGDDSEFVGSGTSLAADAGGAADGRMDLLSVIMHELGHQIGLEDSYDAADANALMHGYLAAGERHLPDGVFEAEAGQAALIDMPLHHPAMLLPLISDVPLQ